MSFFDSLFGKNRKERPSLDSVLETMPSPDFSVFRDIFYNNDCADYVVFGRTKGLFAIRTVSESGKAIRKGDHFYIGKRLRSVEVRKALRDAASIRSIVREKTGILTPVTPILACVRAVVSIQDPILGVFIAEQENCPQIMFMSPDIPPVPDGVLILLREIQGVRTLTG